MIGWLNLVVAFIPWCAVVGEGRSKGYMQKEGMRVPEKGVPNSREGYPCSRDIRPSGKAPPPTLLELRFQHMNFRVNFRETLSHSSREDESFPGSLSLPSLSIVPGVASWECLAWLMGIGQGENRQVQQTAPGAAGPQDSQPVSG